jgi:Tfp pilus assembly protein FimT
LLEAFDMRSLHLLPHQRGASLIETLVATVLGLLVLVLTTNSVLAVVVGENRAGVAKALVSSLAFARTEAAQRRSPVAICGLDARDVNVASGEVRCASPGASWDAGWIVYGDANLSGELDDGEAVLQVVRAPNPTVRPPQDLGVSAAITFRPLGTLASATPRRLLVGAEAAQSAVCVGIDGFTRVLPVGAACQ